MESHLRWCRTCSARVEDMSLIGAAVRIGSRRAVGGRRCRAARHGGDSGQSVIAHQRRTRSVVRRARPGDCSRTCTCCGRRLAPASRCWCAWRRHRRSSTRPTRRSGIAGRADHDDVRSVPVRIRCCSTTRSPSRARMTAGRCSISRMTRPVTLAAVVSSEGRIADFACSCPSGKCAARSDHGRRSA